MKPLLLDTFCKAGGSSMGYHRAGFEVVGVDIEPQKNYPFEFHQGDAIEFIAKRGREFDVIHASPPCQAYSATAPLSKGTHPKLIEPTRAALRATGKPYIIENVPGAPLVNPITLCGSMFNLRTLRHRLFETTPEIWWPPFSCAHAGRTAPMFWGDLLKAGHRPRTSIFLIFQYLTVAGNHYLKRDGEIAMDIDWMIKAELSQAIPPAYTEWLGKQMLAALGLKQADERPEVGEVGL